jgi:iron complex outermembrane receptor protein
MTTEHQAVAAAVHAALHKRILTHGSVSALALSIGLIATAGAQETTETGAGARDATLEEITVTGSRIRRTTDFDTPNPTTVVDAQFLANLGVVNVGDAIRQMPNNISNNTPETTGNANFFTGSTIANLRGLNPFFGSRTLNLVNNRRFVPTNQGDGVDLNFIPTILIDRMDVVTGGASAAYGSGAISGVNNIFLNRTLEGGKLDVDFSQTSEGDGDDTHIGAAFGHNFAGGRGHFVVGYEYQDMESVECLRVRDWCAQSKGIYQSAETPPLPEFLLGSNLRRSQISDTGVFATPFFIPGFDPGPTTLQANAAGTGVVPFNLPAGPYNNVAPFGDRPVIGGDGVSIYEYTDLRAPVEKNVATGALRFDLTDTITLTADMSWGETQTSITNGALSAAFIPIAFDNGYVAQSADLTAAVAAQPFGAFLNKDWTSQVDEFSQFSTEVKRFSVGLDGKFGASSWTWDAYYQYGETDREQFVNDNRHLNMYSMAVDAVNSIAGDATSPVVCRVTREGFAGAVAQNPGGGYASADPSLAAGCVPLNQFGNGAIPDAAKAYSFGYLRENLNYKQQVFAANFTGDLFEGFGAGPIQAAVGLEYRLEEGENVAAEELPDAVRTDFLIQYGESFSGDVDVTEGYVELNVPFVRDRPGAQLIELNVAARESEYKNQGGAGTTGQSSTHSMFTWKVSGVYDPVDWLRFRGTRSRDSRAANFRELYYGQIIGAGGAFGFCGPGPQVDPCTWSLEGNTDLEPEKADTTTFGIVLSPLESLQFAVDYFDIKIEQAIQQANVQGVIAGCRDLNRPEDCGLVTFGPDTAIPRDNITFVRALAFNGSEYKFKGIDVSGSYVWQLNDANTLNFRLLATKMIEQNFQPTPTDPFIDVVGQTGSGNSFLADNQPAAELLATLSATWLRGPFSMTGQVRYIADGKLDYRGITPDDPAFTAVPAGFRSIESNRVPSYAILGLSGSYKFEEMGPLSSLDVFLAIDNLLDKEPPFAAGGGAFGPSNVNGGTNTIYYDGLGRSFRLGLRTTF